MEYTMAEKTKKKRNSEGGWTYELIRYVNKESAQYDDLLEEEAFKKARLSIDVENYKKEQKKQEKGKQKLEK
jgi:hypothetical protein